MENLGDWIVSPSPYSLKGGVTVPVFLYICSWWLLLCIVIVLLWVSWTDLRSRTIANNSVVLLACVVVPFAFLTYGEAFFLSAFLTLFVGFLLFLMGTIGAGDVKLLSALMLATPNESVVSFLFFTALIGGGLAVFGLLCFRQSVSQRGLPYGIAIAGGFVCQQLLFCPIT